MWLSQWEAIQLVKNYTLEQARSEVEYYLGLILKDKQSFQGLIDHLSLAFQACKMVSSLIADFYNQSQKTKDAFADELQVLVRKIVAWKPEFKSEANQALKHHFAQNLRDPYFRVVARDSVCLPLTQSFTKFQGWLALMFNSRGKQHAKVVNATSSPFDYGDTEEHLSHNSRRQQSKIDAQAAEITTVKTEQNKALEENKKLKSLFSPGKMVEAMSKVVSAMTMQGHLKSTKGTQYQGASNYVGRPRQPQLACGANGTLQPSITCFYCKDTGHIKDNCVQLNNKITHELAQEQVIGKKATYKPGTSPQVPKK